jgi:hypothetical protein
MKIKIKLTIKSWNGITGETSSQEIEKIFAVGDKLSEEDFGGFVGAAFVIKHPSVSIVAIDEKKIKIITNGLVVANPTGGIDLSKPNVDSSFSISIGESLKLATQSMDSGFSVEFNPVEIIVN